MLGKIDANGNEYFLWAPRMPMLVDLSSAVVMVYPYGDPDDDEEHGATIMIRTDEFQPTRRRYGQNERPQQYHGKPDPQAPRD
jgi:hypothetical protein